ncbi:serine/threonine protein kinase [Sporothrix stenoceras]|uniref:non-specific serine/threonine protein kinase n=1 Tax=Sporothrix stenoceras TaxID=5173 RepID=A0ABR3YMX4_9PEZI
MNGDLSLSKALGGLRIANPDDTASPTVDADSEPREAFPPFQTSPDPQATYISQSASHSSSSLPVQQQVPSRGPSPLASQRRPQEDASALFKSAQANLSNVQTPEPAVRAPSDPYLQNQYSAYRQGPGAAGPASSTRPMSTIYTSPGSGATTDPTSNSPTGYGALRNIEPARSSSYRQPSRSDSRSQHPPTSYIASVTSSETNHTDRTYNGPRQNLPLSSGSSPLPPRRSSKGMAGGYVSIPAGSGAAPPGPPGPPGMETAVSKSSEEWKERGAAVSVRKEVDASGKPVFRTVKKGVQDFSFGRILGEGSYSSVYLATDRQSLKEYAIKVLEKKHIIKEKKVKYVNIEKNTLNRLTEHPGIVRLYYTFQDEQSLYYVLDLCSGGELLGILKRTGTFDVECTRFYGAQILDAIRYMHSRGVIHRDLKPENVLLDENMHVKITDFGTAKLLPDPRDPASADGNGMGGSLIAQGDGRSASFVGTAEYVSPELLMDKSASKASDLWAFGCIIYQLLAGRPPFKGGSEYMTFQKIVNLDYEFPPGFPSAARDLVERCLVLEPARRLTIEHIMNHEFFDGQPFGRDLWRTKAPRLRPYVPPSQDAHVIQLNGSAPPPQSIPTSRGAPVGASSPSGNGGGMGSQMSPNSTQRPPRIITELPPPTQLDLDWSPVLTRQNERILKLGDLMVVSTPIPNSPHGKSEGDGHKKLSRFFGGNTTKKRQRLVMVTSSGRIVFAPAGGDEKKAKQEISLLNPDCVWKTQTDAKGQPIWCVDTNGTHYAFEEPKGALDGGMAAVEDWIDSLERAKDLAQSQNILSSYRSEEFGDMSSSMSSPASTLGGRMNHSGRSQSNGDDTIISERKRNRFSKRQSKNGLGAQF